MYQVSIVALNKNSCFFSPDVALITEDDHELASFARMSILQVFFTRCFTKSRFGKTSCAD